MLNYLSKDDHEHWLEYKFPQLASVLHGNEKGEFTTSNTRENINYFPIIESRRNKTGELFFRSIIKLTNEPLPENYKCNSEEGKIIGSSKEKTVTYQVILLQVDHEFNLVDQLYSTMTGFGTSNS